MMPSMSIVMIPNQERAIASSRYRGMAAAREWVAALEGGGPAPSSSRRGKLTELIVVAHFGWISWEEVDISWRRVVSGSGGIDRGVDAITPVGDFVQIKDWAAARIGHDPIAKLCNLASQCQRSFALDKTPGCIICARAGTRLGDVAGADVTQLLTYEPADIDAWAGVLAAFTPPTEAGPAGDYSFQADAVVAMLAAPGPTVRARLPPAAGKSRIIARIALHHAKKGRRVAVLAPRILIVGQLHALISRSAPVGLVQGGRVVHRPRTAMIFVACAQSAHSLPAWDWDVVVRDEAHIADGASWTAALPSGTRVYELSATLAGEVCYALRTEELVRRGCACAPEFVFAVHPTEPMPSDVVTHLIAHPEYRCVLACFQTQKSASGFAALCQAAGITAATCLSRDGDAGDEALQLFRKEQLRVLAVVGRVEMGVDVHCCDTVLFAEPWDSTARTLQLIGRGMRLHPSKPGRFTVLVPVDVGAARDRRLRQFVECVASCDFGPSARAVGVSQLVPPPASAPETSDGDIEAAGAAAGAEIRYDMYGREMDRAVSKLFDEHVWKVDEYGRARAIIATLGDRRPRAPEDYGAFRRALDPNDPRLDALPEDPASTFQFDGALRSWGDLLGTCANMGPGPADCAAVMEVLKALGVSTIAEAGPGPALYAQMCNVRPELPPRVDADWSAYFTALETTLMAAQK